MDKIMTPEVLKFTTIEEYAGWLLNQPAIPVEPGKIFIIRIQAEDFTWVKIGDGIRSIIDLPHIS